MKVVIVEDEKLSADHLIYLLQKIDENVEVVQQFDTVKATTEAFLNGLKADLLFFDIHLADGNSFDIFKTIQITIPVVFTTAFDHYAIQAFKQNSVDYLLKPISLQDLSFAVDKFKKQQLTLNENLISSIANAYQQLNKQYKTRFLVKMGQSIDTISTDEIHHFETSDSLSFLVTKKGNKFPVDYSLDQLETMLEPKDFFRTNRKTIIHIRSLGKSNTYFNGRLVISANFLDGDAKIVSRERVNDFKKWLDC